MKTEQWSVLQAWFYKNYKSLPKDVSKAIEALLDEHQGEDDEEDDEDG
jgi:hypothetical protein